PPYVIGGPKESGKRAVLWHQPTALLGVEVMGATRESVQIHETAVVADGTIIGRGCVIHPFVVVFDGVSLRGGVEVFPGACIGKVPKSGGALAHEPTFEVRTVVGADCTIGPNSVVYADVEIGENCLIGDGASVREQCRIGDRVVISRCVTLNFG